MPRRKKSDTPAALSDTLETLKEAIPALKVATELPTHVERLRPTGPRKRGPDEMASVFASEKLNIGLDGRLRTFQMRAERDLTGEEKDIASRNGLSPVDVDTERVWNGKQSEINRVGGDINAVGYLIGKGGGRGR